MTHGFGRGRASCSRMAGAIRAGPLPINVLVPRQIVTSLSVLSRKVRHETPRKLASSCTPPLSVSTKRAPDTSEMDSRHPRGALQRRALTPLFAIDFSLTAVLG